jgi:hypothetical protein
MGAYRIPGATRRNARYSCMRPPSIEMAFSPPRSMGQGRVSTRMTRGDLVHSECGQVLRVLPFHESHCASSCMHSSRGGVEASPHRVCAGSLHGLFRLTPIREAGARLSAAVCGWGRCMDSLLPCTSRAGGCSLAGRPKRIGRHWTYSTIGRHERVLRVSGESAGRVANTAGIRSERCSAGQPGKASFTYRRVPDLGLVLRDQKCA